MRYDNSNINHFMSVFRPVSTANLEEILQSWTLGKESVIWISVEIVVGLVPSLCSDNFKAYMKLGYGQEPILSRLLYIRKGDRKVTIFLY